MGDLDVRSVGSSSTIGGEDGSGGGEGGDSSNSEAADDVYGEAVNCNAHTEWEATVDLTVAAVVTVVLAARSSRRDFWCFVKQLGMR